MDPIRSSLGESFAEDRIAEQGLTLRECLGQASPREASRVVGEQIDGSFELDHEVGLLEAKWHQEPR
jgi:hypothetical protein